MSAAAQTEVADEAGPPCLCRDRFGIEREMRWDAEVGMYAGTIICCEQPMRIWLPEDAVEVLHP